MSRTHFHGPLFVGARTPAGSQAPRIVGRFGGTHSATSFANSTPTQWVTPTATVTSSGRLPYGLYDIAPTDANRGGFVAPRVLVADFIPATKVATLLAASQSPTTSAVTLASANVAGANTPTAPALTIVTYGSETRLRMDTPRAVTITSGSNDSGITFTVTGYDEYGIRMTETITGGNATVATGAKAFFDVISVQPNSTGAVGTVTVGSADVYGLPYRCDKFAYLEIWFNDLLLTKSNSTFVAPVTTTPATATTGDVRGTWVSVADGTKTAQIIMTLPQASNPDFTALYGTVQV